jgi:membrane protein YdbS with pleckstrin-like domain
MATDYVSRLKTIPLFASLGEADLAYVNSIVKPTSYSAGEVVVRQNEEAAKFYIIDIGQVCVRHRDESGAEAIVRFLGPGEFFGEVGLLFGEPRDATIEATMPTTLFYIEQNEFNAMVSRLPPVRVQLEQAAGRRRRGAGLGRFDWQLPDEMAIWVAHRNVLPVIFESALGLTIWLGLAIGLAALAFAGPPRLFEGLHVGRWVFGFASVIVFSLTLAWYFVDWTNDYLVLTNQRVVHIERYGLIREVSNEIPVESVQNVLLSRKGLIDAIFKLGNITVETFGGKLTFTHISEAQHLQERILDQRTRALQEARLEERQTMRQELLKVLIPASVAHPPAPQPTTPVESPAAAPPQPKVVANPSIRVRVREWLRPKTRMEKPGEITWRKHWLLLVWRLILPVLLLLIGPAITLALWLMPALSRRVPLFATWATLLPLVLILPALFWIWWRYAWWRGDEYILTTDRIIDIERHPLGLKETRREGPLQRIQDIEVDITGILSRVFDMGTLYIKTGAAGSDFTFRTVADPRGVQRDIWRRVAEVHRREQEQRRRQISDEVTRWLGVYNELTTKEQTEVEE